MIFRAFFNIKLLPLLVLLGVIGLRIATTSTANFSYLIIAAYALRGRKQAIQALALSWLFSMISPGIAAAATMGSLGRYVVIVAAVASVFHCSGVIVKRAPIKPLTLVTLLLGLFFVVHSLLFSPIVDVSVLKSLSWTLVMVTLIAAWSGLTFEQRELLSRQIFGGLILILLVSLPLLVLPVGYLRNGTGFQGILNHPQAFGPTMSLLGAWAASRMFGQKRPPWSAVALVCTCLVLVVLSEARTAGLALVLGVGIAVFVAPALSGQTVLTVLPGLRSHRIYLVGSLALIGVLLAGPILANKVNHYISKSGRAEASSILQAYEGSRGRLIQEMWVNIQAQPLLGIGFGIASNPASMEIKRDPLVGLPISASIEKGILPLAVLEEVGVFGFSAVVVWVWVLLRRSARSGITPLAVVLTALLLNVGESTLFSPGGMGLLSLILLGWAFSCGQKEVRH